MTLARVNQYGGLHCSQKGVGALGIEVVPTDPTVRWQLQMARPGGGNLQEDPVKKVIEAEDVLLVLGYEWGMKGRCRRQPIARMNLSRGTLYRWF